MSLRLVIEHATHPQAQTERIHHAGDLSIGRGSESDWQLEDPEMFVSRRHCVISGRDGQFTVTDASRGGLFLDGSDTPLGAGIAVPVSNGMRLRLGDVVIRAEVMASAAHTDSVLRETVRAAPLPAGFDDDDFFTPRAAPPPPARPESLPKPFEGGPSPFSPETVPRPTPPPLFDDPFTLDPVSTPAPKPVATPAPAFADFSFSFTDSPQPPPPPLPEPELEPALAPTPEPEVTRMRERPPLVAAEAPPPPPVMPPVMPPARDDHLDAFFRGLGISTASLAEGGTPEEMEALGRRFKLLAEGLVHLLRTRAQEKNAARVAQTLIGASDVNPLKFMVSAEDAVGALVRPRGKGYLGPEEAISAAFRDLSDHQLRTWTALQSALRRMIDRFDPAAFEEETEALGPLKSLMAGSRSARLWQLYTDRYRDIAKSAEDRFLGEVGADFRDAYEGNKERLK